MKRHVRAGLLAFGSWLVILALIGIGATVCTSCGGAVASPASANCAPVR